MSANPTPTPAATPPAPQPIRDTSMTISVIVRDTTLTFLYIFGAAALSFLRTTLYEDGKIPFEFNVFSAVCFTLLFIALVWTFLDFFNRFFASVTGYEFLRYMRQLISGEKSSQFVSGKGK
jgi:hypothetical protein